MTTNNRWTAVIAFLGLFAPFPFVINYAMGRRAKWRQYVLGLAIGGLVFAYFTTS